MFSKPETRWLFRQRLLQMTDIPHAHRWYDDMRNQWVVKHFIRFCVIALWTALSIAVLRWVVKDADLWNEFMILRNVLKHASACLVLQNSMRHQGPSILHRLNIDAVSSIMSYIMRVLATLLCAPCEPLPGAKALSCLVLLPSCLMLDAGVFALCFLPILMLFLLSCCCF